MTELSFAKSFLATLDARPIKLQADYAADPKTFEPKGPYTLPRMPHPMHRAAASPAPGSAPSLTVSLKSLRNPPLDIVLPSQPSSTSILELKQAVAEKVGVAGTDKIRLLYKKKPCADSKTLKDVLGDEGVKEVEFSVMVMGGVEEEEKGQSGEGGGDVVMGEAPVAQGVNGAAVLEEKEFWDDLGGFLRQRVRDEVVAGEAVKIFQKAWKDRSNTS